MWSLKLPLQGSENKVLEVCSPSGAAGGNFQLLWNRWYEGYNSRKPTVEMLPECYCRLIALPQLFRIFIRFAALMASMQSLLNLEVALEDIMLK